MQIHALFIRINGNWRLGAMASDVKELWGGDLENEKRCIEDNGPNSYYHVTLPDPDGMSMAGHSSDQDDAADDAEVILSRLMDLTAPELASIILTAHELSGTMQERIEAAFTERYPESSYLAGK